MHVQEIEKLFKEYFAGNRCQAFGVEVVRAEANLSCIDLRLTFLAEYSYCCAEPICHFSWDRFRQFANERGTLIPDECRICLHGVVEEGAILENLAAVGVPTASEAYEYQEQFERSQ